MVVSQTWNFSNLEQISRRKTNGHYYITVEIADKFWYYLSVSPIGIILWIIVILWIISSRHKKDINQDNTY